MGRRVSRRLTEALRKQVAAPPRTPPAKDGAGKAALDPGKSPGPRRPKQANGGKPDIVLPFVVAMNLLYVYAAIAVVWLMERGVLPQEEWLLMAGLYLFAGLLVAAAAIWGWHRARRGANSTSGTAAPIWHPAVEVACEKERVGRKTQPAIGEHRMRAAFDPPALPCVLCQRRRGT